MKYSSTRVSVAPFPRMVQQWKRDTSKFLMYLQQKFKIGPLVVLLRNFLNGYDVDANNNVLATPLRPGVYWTPSETSQTSLNMFGAPENVLMLKLHKNGTISAIETGFEDQFATGVNGTCKINGTIHSPPDALTIDTHFVLDASLNFESCVYFNNVFGLNETYVDSLHPFGTLSGEWVPQPILQIIRLSDIAINETVLIPFDDLAKRGFRLIHGVVVTPNEGDERVATLDTTFFELCKPDGTLSLPLLEDTGYVCLYDSTEEMFVPTPPANQGM